MKFMPTDFDLDASFPIPANVSVHRVDGRILIIAPEIPAWITVDDAEAEVITRLSKGATIGELISCLASWQVSDPQAKLSDLLTRLAVNDFTAGGDTAPGDKHECRSETTIQLHLTNKCNLRCKHCYVASGEPFPTEMSMADWKAVVDHAVASYEKVYVSISGGEPLLVPWLSDLLIHIKSHGLRTSLLTNGMLWTEKRIAQLKPLADLVNVSLDGASDSVHDRIRGPGAFRQALRGIRRIGHAGIEVGINICLMKSNMDDLLQNFGRLIRDFDFPVSVIFAKFVQEGRGLEAREENLTEADLERVLPLLATEFLSTGWAPTLPSRRLSCGFGKLYAFYANGDVSPCLSPRFIAGNVLRTPVEELFARIGQSAKRAEVDRLPLCRTCDLRYVCGGRCHLPQVTGGREISQNDCSASYRKALYRLLAVRGEKRDAVMSAVVSRVV